MGFEKEVKSSKLKTSLGHREDQASEVVNGWAEITYLWLTATGQCEMQNRHEMMWDVQMATDYSTQKEINHACSWVNITHTHKVYIAYHYSLLHLNSAYTRAHNIL